MKKFILMISALSSVVMFLACGAGSGTRQDAGSQETQAQLLVGTWVSQGADVAPLLAGAPFNYVKLTTVFAANTYVVDASDKSGGNLHLTGTWTASPSDVTNIDNIILNQATPNTITSQGIFEVDSSVTPARLTYEVAQTSPSLTGVSPPVADAGFGSTSNRAYDGGNVQRYTKQ